MAERDIIFRIGEHEYGFDVSYVTAIESVVDIVPVPNAPYCILGLMNLRGEVIPVYSLRRRFQLPEKASDGDSKIIVARYDGKPLAFLVDEVIEMTDFSADKLTQTPLIAQNEHTDYVRAIANKRDKLVLLLNPASMYEGDEEAQMDKVMESLNS